MTGENINIYIKNALPSYIGVRKNTNLHNRHIKLHLKKYNYNCINTKEIILLLFNTIMSVLGTFIIDIHRIHSITLLLST